MRVGFIPTLFFCKIIIKLLLNYIFNNRNEIINPIKGDYMFINECRINENVGENEEKNDLHLNPIDFNISSGDFDNSLKSLKERNRRALEKSLRVIDSQRFFN